MHFPAGGASPTSQHDRAPAIKGLPEGQYYLTAESARPGMIVKAYDLVGQELWPTGEKPIKTFLLEADDNMSGYEGSDDGRSDQVENADGKPGGRDAQRHKDDRRGDNEQEDKTDVHDDSSRGIEVHMFLRLLVATRAFNIQGDPGHYSSQTLITYSNARFRELQADPSWKEHHIPVIDQNTTKAEMYAHVQAFGEVEPLHIESLYGSATIQKACVARLVPNSSRTFGADRAIVTGKVGAESYNVMIRESREMFAPQPKSVEGVQRGGNGD